MFYADINADIFFQGDIIDEFPFLVILEEFNLINHDKEDFYKIEKSSKLEGSEGSNLVVATPLKMHKVIVLSQTCDIQNNNYVAIAPVYSLKEVKEDGRLEGSDMGLIRAHRGKMKDWFYLPGSEERSIEESFVDLQTIQYFPKKLLYGESGFLFRRSAALSDWGRHLLCWALSDFFGRPIEDKNKI